MLQGVGATDEPVTAPVNNADNPFGGNETPVEAPAATDVPEDAKPEAPAGGVVTDNPFA